MTDVDKSDIVDLHILVQFRICTFWSTWLTDMQIGPRAITGLFTLRNKWAQNKLWTAAWTSPQHYNILEMSTGRFVFFKVDSDNYNEKQIDLWSDMHWTRWVINLGNQPKSKWIVGLSGRYLDPTNAINIAVQYWGSRCRKVLACSGKVDRVLAGWVLSEIGEVRKLVVWALNRRWEGCGSCEREAE